MSRCDAAMMRVLAIVVIPLAAGGIGCGDSRRAMNIAPVAPGEDPKTGFVIGGKNETSLILGLKEINGRSIADLEKDMRPRPENHSQLTPEEKAEYSWGVRSVSGFLGPDEKLLDVLAEDNRYVVDELGLTHQELAKPLIDLPALAGGDTRGDARVSYRGGRFEVSVRAYKGHQLSPFKDDTKTNMDVSVTNLTNGKKLDYSLLVPQMIERYGFYEGKSRRYRLEPRDIVEVFDFLKDQAKK